MDCFVSSFIGRFAGGYGVWLKRDLGRLSGTFASSFSGSFVDGFKCDLMDGFVSSFIGSFASSYAGSLQMVSRVA